MKRREVFTLLCGAAAAWPFAARGQQPGMPVIGLLSTASPIEVLHLVAAFREGLREVGYVEGENVFVEYRWAENQNDRLPTLATDLVHRQVRLIVATPSASWIAAKTVTATIPIVLQGGGDPVKLGLVASLNRPGGNATGVITMMAELTSKRLDVLHELVPKVTLIAVLTNPNSLTRQDELQGLLAAARTTHQEVSVVNASSEHQIGEAFATAVQQRAGALFVLADAVFTNDRDQVVSLAARHAIPAIYHHRDFVTAGGLISYGPNLADEWRKTGIYAGRILKGSKPADLPIMLPTKFETVINLKTAKALGLTVPDKLLALADEVME